MTYPPSDADGFGPQDVLRLTDVSRETLERISIVVGVLDRWRVKHNLIGPAERDHLWRRHVLDSVQVWSHRNADNAQWIDLGSGAGFPGLITACAAADAGGRVTLVESSTKKASFLRTAAREAGLPVAVRAERIEDVSRETYHHVTSRALASLPRLLEYASRFFAKGGSCIFLKGKGVEQEIKDAQTHWRFDFEMHHSQSDPEGRVLIIRDLTRKTS